MNHNQEMPNWDSFRDQFNKTKWDIEGVAELQRIYKKNGIPIYKHIPHDRNDHVVPYPIVAKGITAFLADDSITSFKYSFGGQGGINSGIGVQKFFEKYFRYRMFYFRREKMIEDPFYDGKSENQVVMDHLKQEKQLLNQSSQFYIEDTNVITEIIKEAALKYFEWVLDINREKKTRKRGRPNSNPKSIKDYIRNIEENEVERFLNALKDRYEDCGDTEFIYMTKVLSDLTLLDIGNNLIERWTAFEGFFGKTYGNRSNKYRAWQEAKGEKSCNIKLLDQIRISISEIIIELKTPR